MRITVTISGGFAAIPGLSRPVVLDTGEVEAGPAAEVRACVEGAGFFDLDPEPVGRPGAADHRTYQIEVATATGTHRVLRHDPLEDGPLADLVHLVQDLGRRRR